MSREKANENKIDVRLYGTKSNPAEFQTLEWVQANKKAAIDFIANAKHHEILKSNGASHQEVQRAIAQTILFHRYIADSLELQLDEGLPVRPTTKLKTNSPQIKNSAELSQVGSVSPKSSTVSKNDDIEDDDDFDEDYDVIVTAPTGF
jgi:hypothetical protein